MGAGRAASGCGAGFWGGVLAASLLLLCACKTREPAAGKPAPAPVSQPALHADDYAFAGCAVVRSGPRCELSEARELTFWVPTERLLQASTDAGPLGFASTETTGDGRRYRLRVPSGAQFVELREPGAASGFRLPVSDAHPVPVLAQATALRAQGKVAEARALLQAGMGALSPELQARAGALLARLALSDGNLDAAVTGLHASMDAALSSERVSDAVYDATALAYVLIVNLHDYAQARLVLEQAARAAAQDPTGRALLPHYQGLLAFETSDLRRALALFREAALRSEQLGLREHELLARQKEASTLALLGRHAEAVQSQQRVIERFPTPDACRAADGYEHLVWLAISAELARDSALAALAAQATQEAGRHLLQCSSPRRHRNHLINAGLLALQQDAAPQAVLALAELDQMQEGQEGKDALLVTWEFELRGRVALAMHHADQALAAFQRALVLSQRAGLWNNEHLAQLGIARSQQQLEKPRAAVAAYLAADRLLDALLGSIPLGEGQAGFLHERETGTQQLIALLVQIGEPAQALDAARRARARVIRSVSHPARLQRMDAATRARWEAAITRYQVQRAALERAEAEAWKLPVDRLAKSQASFAVGRQHALEALDEAHALLQDGALDAAQRLAAPEPEEALLAYFPGAEGVIGFVARGDATVARVLPALVAQASPAALGAALIAPFQQQLARATRVRIVTHGDLAGLDLHAAELDAAPVIARWPISYALDAPAHVDAAVARSGALVVADPTADLPASRREGQAVVHAFGTAPTKLLQAGEATRAAVLAALPSVDVFHYAGHGQFAGIEGIDSGLRLADGELSLGDILALPAAPRLVVLSACEGARADGPGFAGGLSVAEAFIAAGVRAVVASTRPVDDAVARALVEAFYAALAADPEHSAANALRVAQLALRTERGAADWASFRVLVP
jgi:hypothetical protein